MTAALISLGKSITNYYSYDSRSTIEKLSGPVMLAINTSCLAINWYKGNDYRIAINALRFSLADSLLVYIGNDSNARWIKLAFSVADAFYTFINVQYTYVQCKNELDTSGKVFKDPRQNGSVPFKCLRMSEGEENITKEYLNNLLNKNHFRFKKENGLVNKYHAISEDMVKSVLFLNNIITGFHQNVLIKIVESIKSNPKNDSERSKLITEYESSISEESDEILGHTQKFTDFVNCLENGTFTNS